MVKIQLDDVWWLGSDKRQWILGKLEKRTFPDGKTGDYIIGEMFFVGLENALKEYLQRKLKLSDATSFEQLTKDYLELKERIDNILTKISQTMPNINK